MCIYVHMYIDAIDGVLCVLNVNCAESVWSSADIADVRWHVGGDGQLLCLQPSGSEPALSLTFTITLALGECYSVLLKPYIQDVHTQ